MNRKLPSWYPDDLKAVNYMRPSASSGSVSSRSSCGEGRTAFRACPCGVWGDLVVYRGEAGKTMNDALMNGSHRERRSSGRKKKAVPHQRKRP